VYCHSIRQVTKTNRFGYLGKSDAAESETIQLQITYRHAYVNSINILKYPGRRVLWLLLIFHIFVVVINISARFVKPV
jgi:hypothetical protein